VDVSRARRQPARTGKLGAMRPFRQVDVFTDEFLLGNPVAVVHDADGLRDDQLAAMARWTNLSETTFLLTPIDPAADYRLRIFTPSRELPFAGHPTLGSARAWLEAGGAPKQPGTLVQECGAGLVRIARDRDELAFAAPPLLRDGPVDDDLVRAATAAIGARPEQVRGAQWADNGPGWMALLLDDAETVLGLRVDATALKAVGNLGVIGPYLTKTDADFEVRAFVASDGIDEDPVTGSLNASIAQWLIPAGLAPETYVAAQGTVLQRRGRVRIARRDNEIWVGGSTVVGITGTVDL
jgi:PhzF family phenazine biosynthesis protein